MSSQNSQTSEPVEASMKSLSQQVLKWQKELSEWNENDNVDDTTPQIPILQDSEIHNTIHTAVKVLTASLPKASSDEELSSRSKKANKESAIVNASLDVLIKAAIQPTAKTLFITSGALKPISELLRKACLSQKFVVSSNNRSTNTSGNSRQQQRQQNFDEKKDDDGTISCSSSLNNNATTTTTTSAANTTTGASSCESSSSLRSKTPSMALHCLANLSDNASDAIKNDYLLPIANPLIHNVMEHCLHEQAIQRYSCKMIYHLSNPLLQELVAAGFVEVIWKANQAHPEDAILQHYTNACLYNLLPVCPAALLEKTVRPQQLVQGLVPGMTANPTALEVQKYGLLVMTRVATTHNKSHTPNQDDHKNATGSSSPTSSSFLRLSNSNSKQQQQQQQPPKEKNALQASHALGLPHVIYSILSALNLHAKQDEIAQVGCSLLKHVSRISIDFCLSMMERGGLQVLVRIMQCHLDHPSIQDPVMATLRNLLSLRPSFSLVGMADATTNSTTTTSTTTMEAAAKSIRQALFADASGILYNANAHNPNNGGDSTSTLVAMIRVIGLVMSIHVPDSPIQAYGCDAFGRLAALDDYYADDDDNDNDNDNCEQNEAKEEEENADNNENNNNNNKSKRIRALLFEGNALRLALQAMRVHPNHSGVQDRAIVLLLRLCSYEPAYDFMRREKEMDEETSDEEDNDDEEEDENEQYQESYEYGDEYEDDSIGPVLSSSASGDNSNLSSPTVLPQSFVYKILVHTKVSPRKECHERLQRLLSIVDLQEMTPPTLSSNTNKSYDDTLRESFSGSGAGKRISSNSNGGGFFFGAAAAVVTRATTTSKRSIFVNNLEGRGGAVSERMRNLRESFSSPTNNNNNQNLHDVVQQPPRAASWTSPLKERTSKWWQASSSSSPRNSNNNS